MKQLTKKQKKGKMEKYPFTYYMTLEEWKQWKENFDTYNKKTGRELSYQRALYYRSSFSGIIYNSFAWAETPQGYDYWRNVSWRIRSVKQK